MIVMNFINKKTYCFNKLTNKIKKKIIYKIKLLNCHNKIKDIRYKYMKEMKIYINCNNKISYFNNI